MKRVSEPGPLPSADLALGVVESPHRGRRDGTRRCSYSVPSPVNRLGDSGLICGIASAEALGLDMSALRPIEEGPGPGKTGRIVCPKRSRRGAPTFRFLCERERCGPPAKLRSGRG